VLDSQYLHVGEYNLAGMDFWNVKEHLNGPSTLANGIRHYSQ